MSQLHSLYSVFIMCVTFVNLAEHFVNLWTCRGFRSLTRDCPAVKLFSKHMKVEEQVVSQCYCLNILLFNLLPLFNCGNAKKGACLIIWLL